MRIITSPAVTLVSSPVFHPHPRYELPTDGEPAERLIATAGKICYDSYGVDGNPVVKHVQNLVASGHHSVVEHVHVGVFIEGISRGCSHEIVRHRMFNYSQRSTRYTAEGDAAIVLDPYFADIYQRSGMAEHVADEDPAFIKEQSETAGITVEQYNVVAQFIDNCASAFDAYGDAVSALDDLAPFGLAARDRRKWSRGKARQLLPHALETRMVMTGNLRAWRHFFLMRTNRGAEAEIRRLAASIYEIVAPIAPTVFDDLIVGAFDGYVELTARPI